MRKTQHPVTKKELEKYLDRWFGKITKVIKEELRSFRLDKRLDRIAIGNKLISVRVDDLIEYIRLQNKKIQELEKRIKQLEMPQKS